MHGRVQIRKAIERLRLTQAEYLALPDGCPIGLDTRDKASIGIRWRELWPFAGLVIREFRGVGPDGYLFETYKPIVRVRAISRLVPRPEAVA